MSHIKNVSSKDNIYYLLKQIHYLNTDSGFIQFQLDNILYVIVSSFCQQKTNIPYQNILSLKI